MELKDIRVDCNYYSLPLVTEVAKMVRESVSLTGIQVLSQLSDAEVVNLWQFALKQAQELSRLNVERGLSEIRYPHLWAKKYLFRVYGEWRQQEEDAKSLLRIPTDSHKSYPSIPFISPSSSSLPVAQGKSLDEIRQSINKTFNLPPIK